LNVLATGIKNKNPYKNLIVNGLVLNENGKKMSKRLKNYDDPLLVCNTHGADAVRLYLINSPLVRAANLNFSTDGVKSVVKDIFLPWYNAYRFLVQNISKI
jgi:isoleucyl-tRNA synthetase